MGVLTNNVYMMHKFYLSGKTNSVLLNFDESSSILDGIAIIVGEFGKKERFFNYFKLPKIT